MHFIKLAKKKLKKHSVHRKHLDYTKRRVKNKIILKEQEKNATSVLSKILCKGTTVT